MISRPRLGQQVQLWYAVGRRHIASFHGQTGSVIAAGTGKGPRNHLIDVAGTPVVVPAGNLRRPGGEYE